MTLFEQILAISADVPATAEAPVCVNGNDAEWKETLDKAISEGLAGYLYPAAEKLKCPPTVLDRWKKFREEILIISEISLSQTNQAVRKLGEIGIQAIPLKGSAIAAYYPEPYSRLSQDIDLWAKGPRNETIQKLQSSEYGVFNILSHECKSNLGTGVAADIHFTPQKFNNPFTHKKLQTYFEKTETTSTSFWLVYCLAHTLRHSINGKISWKNVLDYHYLLCAASPEEKSAARAEIISLGLANFARDLCWVLKEEFKDRTEDFFPPRKSGGKRLMEDLRQNTQTAEYKPLAKSVKIFSYLFHYPSEVIFSPFSRTHQFIWRKIQKY